MKDERRKEEQAHQRDEEWDRDSRKRERSKECDEDRNISKEYSKWMQR